MYFSDGWYKTSKGFALMNFARTAFVLFKEVEDEILEDCKINGCKINKSFEYILDDNEFEEVATFETEYGTLVNAINLIGMKRELSDVGNYIWNIYLIPEEDGCSFSSELYENLTNAYPVKFYGSGKEHSRLSFSPKLLIECLEGSEFQDETPIKIQLRKYITTFTNNNMWILRIIFKESEYNEEYFEMFICGMSDDE